MSFDVNSQLPAGATPLSPDDIKALIPYGITTRAQLDQFESRNIQQALLWAMRGTRKPQALLTIDFSLKLHKRMFDQTWGWAGQFRRREVNIGNTPPDIVSVWQRDLCDDARTWIEFGTYPADEICIRLHHRMVWIHPFPNGNGRHARIMADVLLKALGQPVFTWGRQASLSSLTQTRLTYLAALRTADRGDLTPLLAFARS